MTGADRRVACGNCDWQGRESALRPIKRIFERVEAGEPMPAGECPHCGALAHLRGFQCQECWEPFSDEAELVKVDWEKLGDMTALAWRHAVGKCPCCGGQVIETLGEP